MAKEITPRNGNSSDEIDLGQLFQMIGNGFNRFFRSFLSFYLFLKSNALILLALLIIGALIGYGLNKIVPQKLKTEVIVKPNLESKDYLYDVVAEIRANIMAEDTLFFKEIGIDVSDLKSFEIEVAPVAGENEKSLEKEMKYLELLQGFENTGSISDIVRAEILDKNSLDHRITFYYRDAKKGQENAKKLVNYINSNPFYTEMVGIFTQNATNRIQQNDSLIKQIDVLITNYSAKMLKDESLTDSRIILSTEQQLNLPELFTLKSGLIRDTEAKKLELEKTKGAITVINFGKSQKVIRPLFQKNVLQIPLILIGIFFLFTFIKYLNRRAAELKV